MYNTMEIMKVKVNYPSCTEQIKFHKPHHECIWIAYCSTFVGVITSNANNVGRKKWTFQLLAFLLHTSSLIGSMH